MNNAKKLGFSALLAFWFSVPGGLIGQTALTTYLPDGLGGLSLVAPTKAIDNLLQASAATPVLVVTDEDRIKQSLRSEYFRQVAQSIENGSDFEPALSEHIQYAQDRVAAFGVNSQLVNAIETIVVEAVGLVTQ